MTGSDSRKLWKLGASVPSTCGNGVSRGVANGFSGGDGLLLDI